MAPDSGTSYGTRRHGGRRRLATWAAALTLIATAAALLTGAAPTLASPAAPAARPDFGPDVYVFSPSMPQSQIQATVDSIASR